MTSRCNLSVVLHGRLATMKEIKLVKGIRTAVIWQGSVRYEVPMDQVRYK
jgi:hypothetical protein